MTTIHEHSKTNSKIHKNLRRGFYDIEVWLRIMESDQLLLSRVEELTNEVSKLTKEVTELKEENLQLSQRNKELSQQNLELNDSNDIDIHCNCYNNYI